MGPTNWGGHAVEIGSILGYDHVMQTEEEWTKERLVPLLRQLGFIKVEYTHGPREKGRDVVFADFDRFGIMRYYGAQVKVGTLDASQGGQVLNTVIAQLETAWSEPYRDASNGTDHQLSGVYLIVSGRITEEARERISNKTGNWLHLVDADQLVLAEHSSHSMISNTERIRIICMAKVEVAKARPRLERLLQDLKAFEQTRSLGIAAVFLPTRSAARALDTLLFDLDPRDLSSLWDYQAALGQVRFTIERVPIGTPSGDISGTIGCLITSLPDVLGLCRRVEWILDHAVRSERPGPGQRLMQAPATSDDATFPQEEGK